MAAQLTPQLVCMRLLMDEQRLQRLGAASSIPVASLQAAVEVAAQQVQAAAFARTLRQQLLHLEPSLAQRKPALESVVAQLYHDYAGDTPSPGVSTGALTGRASPAAHMVDMSSPDTEEEEGGAATAASAAVAGGVGDASSPNYFGYSQQQRPRQAHQHQQQQEGEWQEDEEAYADDPMFDQEDSGFDQGFEGQGAGSEAEEEEEDSSPELQPSAAREVLRLSMPLEQLPWRAGSSSTAGRGDTGRRGLLSEFSEGAMSGVAGEGSSTTPYDLDDVALYADSPGSATGSAAPPPAPAAAVPVPALRLGQLAGSSSVGRSPAKGGAPGVPPVVPKLPLWALKGALAAAEERQDHQQMLAAAEEAQEADEEGAEGAQEPHSSSTPGQVRLGRAVVAPPSAGPASSSKKGLSSVGTAFELPGHVEGGGLAMSPTAGVIMSDLTAAAFAGGSHAAGDGDMQQEQDAAGEGEGGGSTPPKEASGDSGEVGDPNTTPPRSTSAAGSGFHTAVAARSPGMSPLTEQLHNYYTAASAKAAGAASAAGGDGGSLPAAVDEADEEELKGRRLFGSDEEDSGGEGGAAAAVEGAPGDAGAEEDAEEGGEGDAEQQGGDQLQSHPLPSGGKKKVVKKKKKKAKKH
jgi:hypothetical protein